MAWGAAERRARFATGGYEGLGSRPQRGWGLLRFGRAARRGPSSSIRPISLLPMAEIDPRSTGSALMNIAKRPGLFWEDSDDHSHSFLAFVPRYQTGRDGPVGEQVRSELDEILPPRFHEFVAEYIGRNPSQNSLGWMGLIEEDSGMSRRCANIAQLCSRVVGHDAGDALPAPVLGAIHLARADHLAVARAQGRLFGGVSLQGAGAVPARGFAAAAGSERNVATPNFALDRSAEGGERCRCQSEPPRIAVLENL